MPNIFKVILAGIAMLVAGWFAGANLTAKQAAPIATSTTQTATKEVVKEVIKEVPVIKEKIVVQDISQTKINEYEGRLLALQNKLNQTYREVGDPGDPNGYIVRLYPHDGGQPEYLDKIAVFETGGSKNSGMTIKVQQQTYDSQLGFTNVASTTYAVDVDSFVKNLNITLEKTASGQTKYYYKFYALVDDVYKFLFSFPTK